MNKTRITTFALGLFAVSFAETLSARTWTSVDGERTFEGEFVRTEGDIVTVRRGKKEIRFKVDVLCAADVAYVESRAKHAAAVKASQKFRDRAVPKSIAGKLAKLEGANLVGAPDSEIVPEYYFLAYSASW